MEKGHKHIAFEGGSNLRRRRWKRRWRRRSRRESENENEKNRNEVMMALAALGRSLENLPADLAMAMKEERVPAAIIHRYAELEKSGFFRWLLQFGGFKERLLADDLFLVKIAIECGVGIFTKACFNFINEHVE